MGGLCAEERRTHETHLGYKSRGMYHAHSNLVKPLSHRRGHCRPVDKPVPVPIVSDIGSEPLS